FLLTFPLPPSSTLFPYTTLFRSHFDSPADTLVASRILKNPDAYRRWEAEHDRLMRAVSEQVRLPRQVVALRSTAFALVHRKAILDRKSTRLNSSHSQISYAVFCL